jgi:MFS family permease
MTYESNIWKFYVYKFLSSFFFIGPIVILFYVSYISYSQFGIVIAVGLGTMMLFEIPSGVLADLFSRKKIVSLGLLLAAFEMFVIGFGQSFNAFIIAAILGGIGAALISGADTSLLYDSLKAMNRENDSKKIYGKLRAIRYWAIVLAALIGAPIYVILNYLPFLLNGIILLLTALFFLSLKEPAIRNKNVKIKNLLLHFKDSFSYSWNNKKLLWFIFFSVFTGFAAWIYHDMMRSPFYEHIGYPIAILGVLTAIITIVRSFFSLYAHKIEEKFGMQKNISLILFGQAPLFILMYCFYSKIAFIFVLVLYCIWSLQEVLSEVYSHENMNSKQRATLASIQSFYNSTIILIGSLITGFIIEIYSLRIMLLFLGIISFISGIILLKTKHKM